MMGEAGKRREREMREEGGGGGEGGELPLSSPPVVCSRCGGLSVASIVLHTKKKKAVFYMH